MGHAALRQPRGALRVRSTMPKRAIMRPTAHRPRLCVAAAAAGALGQARGSGGF